MQIFRAGTVFASIFIIFSLLQLNFSSAEVRKPIKPKFRIVQGATDPVPRKINPARKSEASSTWKIISGTKDIGVLNRFISQYPESFQASLAAQRRRQLQRAAVEVKADRSQPPQEVSRKLSSPNLVFDIQNQLSRVGCQPGRADGKWGRKSVLAAQLYSKHANIVVETGRPNVALLASVKASKVGVCPLACGAKFSAVGGQCVVKTCGRGQKLSSKGQCYTPKTTKSCKRGERLSSRGVCFVPKTRTRKVSTPRKVAKPSRNRCSWCAGRTGGEQYVCGSARIASMRARGNCN